ncbi:TetR/AcrR family transcriptional regulator [Lutibacter sp. B1]|uniref:TetR/AcrR family transcriptional regulator n=1 Tax=Lutibacter sp. B1 TaxID=2725996 RepID=UPI001456360B|nr:TetR/AcrR family transcriptional regulator [Lutibacter sp. B1]NLP58812.1 TetR/AcrR family transcriptional regulator [Lutibacter sp. B1]
MAIDQTRDKIVDAAERLFSKFGFHKTSMDEIAKVSRKAKGSLYYHFASKEDLFRQVVSNELVNFKNQMSLIIDDNNLKASEKIKLILITRMRVVNEAANYHDTLKADFFEHYDFIDDLRIEHDKWEKSILKDLIIQGVESGEFTTNLDVDELLEMYLMLVKGLEIPFFLQNKYKKYYSSFEKLIDIFIKGLKP